MSATLATLAQISGGRIIEGSADQAADIAVSHISLDSSELTTESLFAALPGTKVHGAKYAANTPAKAVITDEVGAEILREAGEQRPVIVVEDIRAVLGPVSAEVFGHPSKQLTIIGITGTSGKTTTSFLLEAGLIAEGHSVGLIGTTGSYINRESLPTKLTTPEAPKLQELFAKMLANGVTHVVMEVSSHAISLGRIAGTHFTVGAFTNLSQDHLDFHNSMDEYFEAKAGFFRQGSPVRAEKCVICIDDDWGKKMAEIAGPDTVTVSTRGEDANFKAHDIETAASGAQQFKVLFDGHDSAIALSLPGQFNVANATLAFASAVTAGSAPEAIVRGFEPVGVPGRMERIDEGQDFLAVVDYAHKPAAVAAVLDSVRSQVSGRVAVVLGAGGDRDAAKRPIMGAEAVHRADLVIITDDNPRSEKPETIRAAVLDGANTALEEVTREVEVREIGDRAEAINAAVEWAQSGDAIIVAGKGHENGQLIAGINHPFDDRDEVRKALRKRRQ